MKKIWIITLTVISSLFFLSSCSKDDDKKEDRQPVKVVKQHEKAILLATFGSTWEGPHKTYQNIRDAYKKEFPDYDIYFSMTSTKCITRWGAKTHEYFATPDLWLKAIGEAGYKEVKVQSLHVIPGEEFGKLRDFYIKDFMNQFPNVKVYAGHPLLWDKDVDIPVVAKALNDIYKSLVHKGEAVAFMGHGNPDVRYDFGNVRYREIEKELKSKYNKNYFVATVDYGEMLIDYLVDEIKSSVKAGTHVNLVPLMSIAGDHANNDMAGDEDPKEKPEDQSWKVILKKAGFSVDKDNIYIKGLGDYPEVLKVWIKHTHEAEEIE
ncbi:sirohydrochlorin cobaltochelatase [Porphyromonas pogonae]|uniref:sirohydrochlorin cobaltochelatase n=1 Tax=Porphyromonas pogonae TaxID=867595 RepID=UPI002E77234A|nr:sirohydrochlorin cobaltochelatase [Porphyromonas pogonae]